MTAEQIAAEAMVDAGAPLMGSQVEEAVVTALRAHGYLREGRLTDEQIHAEADRLYPESVLAPENEELADAFEAGAKYARGATTEPTYYDIVFDGEPGPEGPIFVETEDANGNSVRLGNWVKWPDDYWVLRIEVPQAAPAFCGECAGPYPADSWPGNQYAGHWDTCPNRPKKE